MAKKKQSKTLSAATELFNTIGYVMVIIGAALIISTLIIVTANDALALVKNDMSVTLTVPDELTSSEMCDLLKEYEIVNYSSVFRIFLIFKGVDTFEKGTFELNSSMDYGQILSTLKRTKTGSVVKVTIPEGFNMKQIAQLMEDSMVCSAESFITTANTYDFSHESLKDLPMQENRLEGYLYPDTYDFYINENTVSVINKLLNNFEKRYTEPMRELTKKAGKSINDIMIVASLIEKEARIDTERAVISSVIYNRLKAADRFPYLQIDATLMYVTGHKDALTVEDLAIDSPYNTYNHHGLPPTPICNPGLPSILAAISPEKSSFYYYVVNPETGAHIFSKTLDEHNRAVAKMNKLK